MHPIEAGLPPLIEVLDEVASSVAFEERWSVLQRELLEDDDLGRARPSRARRRREARPPALAHPRVRRRLGPHRPPRAQSVPHERRAPRHHRPGRRGAVCWPIGRPIAPTTPTNFCRCSRSSDAWGTSLGVCGRRPGAVRAARLGHADQARQPRQQEELARGPARTEDQLQTHPRGRYGRGRCLHRGHAAHRSPTGSRGRCAKRRWPAPRKAPWSSTTSSSLPANSCATCRRPGVAAATRSRACCSTSSRTPTRSRSSWPCGSPAGGPRTAREWQRRRGPSRVAVRRGRPEAVDLPLPAGQHRDLPRDSRWFGGRVIVA